ncbi:KR domain-containing protein [Streptomyces sp. NBC_00086]|uniref:KR domain-containing protein n=1 Tax=unclassified Streptomyces TaxID=2593676 RepID=UPI00338F2D99
MDFFTLFSSCGRLPGITGQGDYASGNAFLDALAPHPCGAGRRGHGAHRVDFVAGWVSACRRPPRSSTPSSRRAERRTSRSPRPR